MHVSYTRTFLKQASRLPQNIIDIVGAREIIFRENPFDPRLKTHKLHGKEKELLAFSVMQSYRIIFIFLSPQHVLFLEIGTHAIYK